MSVFAEFEEMKIKFQVCVIEKVSGMQVVAFDFGVYRAILWV